MLYKGGTEFASLKLDALRTYKLSWFSKSNFIQSPWADLKIAPHVQTFSHCDHRMFETEAYHLEAFNFPYTFETMLPIIPDQ